MSKTFELTLQNGSWAQSDETNSEGTFLFSSTCVFTGYFFDFYTPMHSDAFSIITVSLEHFLDYYCMLMKNKKKYTTYLDFAIRFVMF